MTTFACQFAFIAAFVTFSSFSYLFIIPFLSPLFNQINYSYKINTINYVVIIPRRTTTKCRERSGQARRGGGEAARRRKDEGRWVVLRRQKIKNIILI